MKPKIFTTIEDKAKSLLRLNPFIEEKEIVEALGITDRNTAEYVELHRFLAKLRHMSKGTYARDNDCQMGYGATTKFDNDTVIYYYLEYEEDSIFSILKERLFMLVKESPNKLFSENDVISKLPIIDYPDKVRLDRLKGVIHHRGESEGLGLFTISRRLKNAKWYYSQYDNLMSSDTPSDYVWFCYYVKKEKNGKYHSMDKQITRLVKESKKQQHYKTETEKDKETMETGKKEGFVESRYVLYMFLFFAVVFACIHFFDMNAFLKIVQMFTENS